MTKEELVSKAKYIQFPYTNSVYMKIYNKRQVNRLPIAEDYNPLYSDSVNDKHHYTTRYHYEHVLPLLNSIYKFGYKSSDFELVKLIKKDGDYSYMVPKRKFVFKLYQFDLKMREIYDNQDFYGLMNESLLSDDTKHRYWGLYRFAHHCSRIVNKSLPENGRKLFISGDSQIIPSIPILACYFREVWYFDNRTGYKTGKRDENGNYTIEWIEENHISCRRWYESKTFSDVLIQLYTSKLERYEKWNIY